MHVTTSLSFVIISDYFQPLFYRIERLVSHTCICSLQASQGKALRFFGDVYLTCLLKAFLKRYYVRYA